MAIERKSYVERVLIVLNEDGSLRGAAQYRLQRIQENGTDIMAPEQGPATAIDAGTLASVLPDQAALLAQISSLQAQLAALQAPAP